MRPPACWPGELSTTATSRSSSSVYTWGSHIDETSPVVEGDPLTKDAVSNPHDVKMGLSPDRLGFGVRADVASFADDAESTESSRS